jgi:hypothetical protein
VHGKAIETAETDATKRALATFGKPFGLSLYLESRKPRAKPTPSPIQRRRTQQRLGPNGRYRLEAYPKQPSVSEMLARAAGAAVLDAGASSDDVAIPDARLDGAASCIAGRTGRRLTQQTFIEKSIRRRDRDHLGFVAGQRCLICRRTPSDPHHLRFAQPRAMASKVSDEFTVPLCRMHHRQLHQAGNEINWWMDLDIDPLPIAQDLWT